MHTCTCTRVSGGHHSCLYCLRQRCSRPRRDLSSARLQSWCRYSQKLLATAVATGPLASPHQLHPPICSSVFSQCWPVGGPKPRLCTRCLSMRGASAFLSSLMEESKMWATSPKPWPSGPPQVRPSASGAWWNPCPQPGRAAPNTPSPPSHDGLPPGRYY